MLWKPRDDGRTSHRFSSWYVDSHNIVCSWCPQAHVSIHSCDFFRMDTFKEKKSIESCCTVLQPKVFLKKEVQAEILGLRVSICGTKDAGRGLWRRLKNTCKQFKFSLNQILPTLFTLRDDESRIIAVMSSIVDDLLYGSLPEGAEAMNSVLQQFLVGKEEHGIFRLCGKEFRQDEDFGLHVTAKGNTERAQPITCDMKHGLTRKATSRRNTSIEIRHTISRLDRKTNTP